MSHTLCIFWINLPTPHCCNLLLCRVLQSTQHILLPKYIPRHQALEKHWSPFIYKSGDSLHASSVINPSAQVNLHDLPPEQFYIDIPFHVFNSILTENLYCNQQFALFLDPPSLWSSILKRLYNNLLSFNKQQLDFEPLLDYLPNIWL